ncbi:hypothetical protein [Streptomyces hydrogenans]|uniref:Uncharacterized protein n=1 Tax=Streptomyces hydrogenans TaxID=1873719 RepID=A0ABQ3PQE9_9ACTN|nr:hypothetical protein [Streptomyces hydrogenans]GHE25260.1 hypothetical protein GCM10018784_73750 [Streptomyces hydrogenans]GHI27230.1 hypothetical protein Shyd_86010 [Streptomyces hydrogenans]
MDLNWYIVGKILPLGRLIGHSPSTEERKEEQDLCRRLARGEHLDKEELDACFGPAAWAWIGAVMASIAALAVCGRSGDSVGGVVFEIINFALLAVFGTAGALVFICLFRNAMLDRTSEWEHGSWRWRVANRCYYPRAYDFWLAVALAVWPTLWATRLV